MTSYVTREEYDRMCHRLEKLEGASRDGGIKLEITVTGGDVDDHVRMLVKRGVGEGLSQYNKLQRRGDHRHSLTKG